MITTSNKLDLWTTPGGLVQRLGISYRFEPPRFKVDNLTIDIQRSPLSRANLRADTTTIHDIARGYEYDHSSDPS
jgi:hypothetical protein